MNKNKRPLILLGLLAALILIFSGIYIITRPAPVDGIKTITVEVIHRDASSRTFTYETQAEYLGEVLRTEGLIQGKDEAEGFFITEVDGEQAIWDVDKAYWALYLGDDYATTGVELTPIADGDAFSLIYTAG